jgi:hypothetical protein
MNLYYRDNCQPQDKEPCKYDLSDGFLYNCQYQILICITCGSMVQPGTRSLYSHLNTIHQITGAACKTLIERFSQYELCRFSQLCIPNQKVAQIQGLPVYKGFRCRYLKAYPDLLFLDCTYKTNKYGMPLLNMININACQQSFCIAFAFLNSEAKQDFIWALDRLRSLYKLCNTRFPSIILTDRNKAYMNAVESCFPS